MMKKSVLKFAVCAAIAAAVLPVSATWQITTTGQWGSITDSETGWVLGANLKNTAATIITSVKTAGTGSVLDLRDTEGFTITQIGQGGLSLNNQSVLKANPVTEIILPDSQTSFGNYALQDPNAGPHNLEKVTIGKGVTSIPSSAFMKCTALKEVHCNGFPFSTTYSTSANLADLPAYETRVFYPMTDANWSDFVKSNYVTAWDDLSDEIKAKYTYTDGITPKYLSTRTGLKNFWLIAEGEASDSVKLIVAANGTEHGVVEPAYSADPVEYPMSALPLTCTAPEYDKGDTTLWRCASYTLRKLVDGTWTDIGTTAGHEFSFNPDAPGNYMIVWNWELAGYRIPSLGTFDGSSIGGTFAAQSESAFVVDDYWPVGASVTFTAGGAAPFERWFGDVDKANSTVNPLTLVLDAPRDFVPVFRTPWQVAEDGKTMSDGYWRLKISGSTGHTIGSGPTSLLACGVVDLSKPISDGLPVTAIGASAFQNNTGIVELILPASTVKTIDNNAFDGCSKLVRVEPFLPNSITTLGVAAFSQCSSLEGDLVIGGSGKTVEFTPSDWAYQFRDCRKIRSVTFGKRVGDLRKYSFWNCTGLKEMKFYGKPSIVGVQSQVAATFQGISTYQKVYLSAANADWCDFVADTTYVSEWSALSEATQKKYTDAFPDDPLPMGLSTVAAPFGEQWIFTFDDRKGFLLLVK